VYIFPYIPGVLKTILALKSKLRFSAAIKIDELLIGLTIPENLRVTTFAAAPLLVLPREQKKARSLCKLQFVYELCCVVGGPQKAFDSCFNPFFCSQHINQCGFFLSE
jgi:hypothetical protein